MTSISGILAEMAQRQIQDKIWMRGHRSNPFRWNAKAVQYVVKVHFGTIRYKTENSGREKLSAMSVGRKTSAIVWVQTVPLYVPENNNHARGAGCHIDALSTKRG